MEYYMLGKRSAKAYPAYWVAERTINLKRRSRMSMTLVSNWSSGSFCRSKVSLICWRRSLWARVAQNVFSMYCSNTGRNWEKAFCLVRWRMWTWNRCLFRSARGGGGKVLHKWSTYIAFLKRDLQVSKLWD